MQRRDVYWYYNLNRMEEPISKVPKQSYVGESVQLLRANVIPFCHTNSFFSGFLHPCTLQLTYAQHVFFSPFRGASVLSIQNYIMLFQDQQDTKEPVISPNIHWFWEKKGLKKRQQSVLFCLKVDCVFLGVWRASHSADMQHNLHLLAKETPEGIYEIENQRWEWKLRGVFQRRHHKHSCKELTAYHTLHLCLE